MIKQLKDGNVDIIVALTEGLVTEISRGSDILLLGTYVVSGGSCGIDSIHAVQ